MGQACDQAHANRVHRQHEDDWDYGCYPLDCNGRVSTRDNGIDFKADKLSRDLFEAFATSLRPAILDRKVATFNPAEFAQPLRKSGGPWCPGRGRSCAQKPDGGQSACLLRARRERPCCRRTAEQRDELASLHSMTSSARASSVGGTSRPSALAVPVLM